MAGAALACAVMIGGGCRSDVALEEGARHPMTAQVRVLDVQVFRHGTTISMANTSGETLAGRMWINQWFSREVGPIAPGESVTMSLKEFEDRFGTAFRAGGFFARENPEPVVLAQIEMNGELVGLVAVAEEQ